MERASRQSINSASSLDVALRAIALGLKCRTRRVVASAARGLIRLGRLMQTRFEFQWSLAILLEQLVVTRLAIAVGTF